MSKPQVNIQNGTVINNLSLQYGEKFEWSNPTGTQVQMNNCGGFCTQSTYTVPAKTDSGNGLAEAQLLASPTNYTFSESPNEWNAPGMPHIQTPTRFVGHQDKDVA